MRHFWIASLLVLTWTSVALAEGPEGAPPQGQQPPPGQAPPPDQAPPPGQQQYEVQPTPTYDQQPPPPGQEEPPPTGTEGRGIEYGAHILVPIWLTLEDLEGNPAARPGIGIQGRVGWEFGGGVTAELSVGVMGNGFTDEFVEQLESTGILVDGISNIWIGGGARYMFFNPSAFVPFIGAAIKLNLWNDCVDGSCSGNTNVTLGFTGTVGAAYEISPYIAIEAGLDLNSTLPGKQFEETEFYIAPFLGGTLYF